MKPVHGLLHTLQSVSSTCLTSFWLVSSLSSFCLYPLSANGRSEYGVKPIEGSAVCQFWCESLLHSREKEEGGPRGVLLSHPAPGFPCLNCSRTCGSPPDGQLIPLLAGQGREQKQEGQPLLCVDWSDRGGTADLAEPAPRNPVYSGNTDGLQPNRHFYLQGENPEVHQHHIRSHSAASSTNQRQYTLTERPITAQLIKCYIICLLSFLISWKTSDERPLAIDLKHEKGLLCSLGYLPTGVSSSTPTHTPSANCVTPT